MYSGYYCKKCKLKENYIFILFLEIFIKKCILDIIAENVN